MKLKLLDIILYSNQVILFLLIITGVVYFIVRVHQHRRQQNRFPTRIEIVDEIAQPAPCETPVYKKLFWGRRKDVYIIELYSTRISEDALHNEGAGGRGLMARRPRFNPDAAGSLVNVMFVAEDNSNGLLFERDCLITDVIYADFSTEGSWLKMERNLYTAVVEDSNGDGFLGEDDRKDLYASDYDGSNLTRVLDDISSISKTQDNRVLITQGTYTDERFHLYDLRSGKLRLLNTNI